MAISLMDWLWKILCFLLWPAISLLFYDEMDSKFTTILVVLIVGVLLAMVANIPDWLVAVGKLMME